MITCIKVVLPEPAMPMHKTTVGCFSLFDFEEVAEVDIFFFKGKKN